MKYKGRKILAVLMVALLAMAAPAFAACDELGCWKLEVLAPWTQEVIDGTTTNSITVNERYPGKCGATRDLTNVMPDPNSEIWLCYYDEATAEQVQADSDFYIMSAQIKVLEWSCSDPLYETEGDCITVDYACSDPQYDNQSACEAAEAEWVGTQRGIWTSEEVWE